MFLVQATTTSGKLLELNTELIRVLDKVRTLLKEDDEDLDWGDVLLELLRKRNSRSMHAAIIDQALSELGIDEDAVNQRLDRLRGYLVEIQDGMEPLLLKLGTPGSLAKGEIGFTASERSLEVGQVAFLVGGDLQADLGLSSFAGSTLPADWAGSLATDRALQEIAVGGTVAVNGSARGSWSAVSLSASASTSGSGRIRLYHEYNAETPRIAALVVAAGNWATPWELDGLMEQLRRPDETGFRCVALNGTGDVDFAGGVGFGYAATFDRTVRVPDGTETLGAEAKMAGSVEFSFRQHGSFSYRIQKDASGALLVRLERASGSEHAGALNLDASVRIDGLDEIGDRYARAFFKDPEVLLDKLKQWRRPGDMLVDSLAKKDWDQPLAKEIGAVLIGEAKAQKLSSVAVAEAEKILRKELNEHLPFWSMESGTLARKLISRISERLDLDSKIAEKLHDALDEKLQSRIDETKSKLEKDIDDLRKAANDIGTEILDPLEQVGIAVGELRDKANATAKNLLQPIIDFLKRYEQIRLRILGALKQTARLKLGMSIGASMSRTRERTALLSFRVREVDENTRAVHRAFVLGRLPQAWSEFEEARSAGAIDQIDGVFKSMAMRERKISFSLHLGDFGSIQRFRVKAEEVHFSVDPSGNILAAETRLTQEAVAEAFHVHRSIGVVGSYDLVAALRDPEQVPNPVSFSLGYSDEKLRHPELKQFLRSLEDDRLGRPLLAPGAADRALDEYSNLLTQHGLSKASGRVDLAFPITLASLEALLDARADIGRNGIRRRAVEVQLRLTIPTSGQESLLQSLAAHHKGGMSEVDFVLDMCALGRRAAADMARLSGGSTSHRFSPINRLADLVERICESADELVRVVDGVSSIAELQDEIRGLAESSADSDLEPLRRRLEKATRKINDGLDRWLEVRSIFSGIFTEAVPPRTVAFLALLSELDPDHAKLIPIVKVDDVEGGLIMVV